jgi:hypothetical protein
MSKGSQNERKDGKEAIFRAANVVIGKIPRFQELN